MKTIGSAKGGKRKGLQAFFHFPLALFRSKTDREYIALSSKPITEEDEKRKTELENAIELTAPLAAAYAELFRLSERLRKDEISSAVYLKEYDLLVKKVAVFYQDKSAFLKFVGAAASIEDFTK